MPQAIPMVVAAITTAATATATAVGASAAAAAAFATFAVNAVGTLALSAALTLASTAMQPKVASSGTAIDWTADPDAPMHFAFGRVGVAGQLVHNAVYGPDKMFVGFVGVVSSAGPINGFVGFRADETTVTFDGSGKAITSDYAGEMYLTRQVGLQPTTTGLSSPSGLKNGATMPGWGSSYKLNAKAAYMMTLAENSKRSAFEGKVPTGIHTLEGLRCWDPRLDSTYPGGSGSCRLNDPATWLYSTNAYLHALKWVLGLWEGPTLKGAPAHDSTTDYQVGGIGARVDGVVVQDYVEAATAFDENETWACAAWPSTDDDKAAVLDSFLQAGGGIYAQKAGKIGCVHRIAPRASVATITGADTAGPLELTLATARKDRINTIRPKYWSEANQWQMTAAGEVTSSIWQEEDGQGAPVKRTRGIDYNYVPGAQQAAELAALDIAHTREGIKGVIPLRPYMMGLEVGDCITLDEPDFVLDGQKVLILDIDDQTETDVIRVSFVSESDGKYPFAYGQTATPPPAATLTPLVLTVDTPDAGDWSFAAETLTEGAAAVPSLVFSGEVGSARAEQVIFEYRVVDTPERPWAGAGVEDPNVTRKEVTSVTSSTIYEGAVSYRVGNRVSDRLVLGPVTVGVFVAPGGGDASALRSSVSTAANQASSGATWVTWGTASYTDLPSGGTLKTFISATPESGMTITGGIGSVFDGLWRIRQGGTTIASGTFTATDGGGDPNVSFVTDSSPITPAATGATSLVLEISRASGGQDITGGGVAVQFYAEWIRTG